MPDASHIFFGVRPHTTRVSDHAVGVISSRSAPKCLAPKRFIGGFRQPGGAGRDRGDRCRLGRSWRARRGGDAPPEEHTRDVEDRAAEPARTPGPAGCSATRAYPTDSPRPPPRLCLRHRRAVLVHPPGDGYTWGLDRSPAPPPANATVRTTTTIASRGQASSELDRDRQREQRRAAAPVADHEQRAGRDSGHLFGADRRGDRQLGGEPHLRAHKHGHCRPRERCRSRAVDDRNCRRCRCRCPVPRSEVPRMFDRHRGGHDSPHIRGLSPSSSAAHTRLVEGLVDASDFYHIS